MPTGGVRSFRISTDRIGPRRWCWVRLHPTTAHMHAAAHRRSPWEPRSFWDGCEACFQPTSFFEHSETKVLRYLANGYAGVLRLVAGKAGAEVVAHELVHAAATVFRMNCKRDVRLGADCGRREEDFAYIYGELYASFEAAWHALEDS